MGTPFVTSGDGACLEAAAAGQGPRDRL